MRERLLRRPDRRGRACSTRCWRSRCSRPAWRRGARCRPPTYLWTRRAVGGVAPGRRARRSARTSTSQDAAVQFQPALQATRAALPHIPLWDPVHARRPAVPRRSAVGCLLAVQRAVVRAAVLEVAGRRGGAQAVRRGAGRLPARRARSECASAVRCMSGLVFGFSLWTVSWVSWPHDSVWAFLPWLCLLCELTVRRPGPLPFAGLAGVVGLQFLGGHPASSLQVLFVVVLFWIGRVLASPELRPRAAPRLLTLAAGAGRRRRARRRGAGPVRRAARALERRDRPSRRLGPAQAADPLPAGAVPARLLGARPHGARSWAVVSRSAPTTSPRCR